MGYRSISRHAPRVVHACRIPPRQALDFARALRVHLLSRTHNVAPSDLLDFSDPRSLRQFLIRGGLSSWDSRPFASPVAFCSAQTFLTNQQILHEVLHLLSLGRS